MVYPIIPGGVQPDPNAVFGNRAEEYNVKVLGIKLELMPSPGEKVRQCVVCREPSPSIFPNEQSRKEYQELSGICPCCWEVRTLDPGEESNVLEASNDILAFYGRRLILGKEFGRNKWQCLRCKAIVQGADLERPHVCEGQNAEQNASLTASQGPPSAGSGSLNRHGVDISPANDGGLVKVTNQQGLEDQPQIGDYVHIHYVCSLKNGVKFDSSRDRSEEFCFVLGQGRVISGLDICVATMEKGEVCDLICAPAFANSAKTASLPKIPPNETLIFEIELLSWEEADDISPLNDMSITKRVLHEGGDQWESPNEDSVIEAQIVGRYADRVFVDGDFKFHLGECTDHGLPGGIDEALKHFRKGETSFIALQPSWGYGVAGKKDRGISPIVVLGFEVHLKDFSKAKEPWEMTDDEMLLESEALKARGNEFFKSDKLNLAIAKYKKVVGLLQNDSTWKDEAKTKRDQLYTATRLNLALCHLKLSETSACIEYCSGVLSSDTSNVKALFRRGQAYQQQREYENAVKDYSRVLAVERDNKVATAGMQHCKEMLKAQNESDKKLYANMFKPHVNSKGEANSNAKTEGNGAPKTKKGLFASAKKPRTVDLLLQCVMNDLLPSNPALIHEWGFKNCKNEREESRLLSLYIGLLKLIEITPKELEDWWESGTLIENIKKSYEQFPPENRGAYYPWFLENQHILKNLTKFSG